MRSLRSLSHGEKGGELLLVPGPAARATSSEHPQTASPVCLLDDTQIGRQRAISNVGYNSGLVGPGTQL